MSSLAQVLRRQGRGLRGAEDPRQRHHRGLERRALLLRSRMPRRR